MQEYAIIIHPPNEIPCYHGRNLNNYKFGLFDVNLIINRIQIKKDFKIKNNILMMINF